MLLQTDVASRVIFRYKSESVGTTSLVVLFLDLHLLKFFVAETGAFLPRRMTMATRRQQVRVFRAIKQAQHLGVFPRGWKPLDTEQMRMEDPLQVLHLMEATVQA